MNSKIKSKLSLNRRLLLLLPYLVIALLLIILPIILIIVNAFIRRENFDTWSYVKSPTIWVMIWRSLKIGIFSSILCLLIGFPYAYFVATNKSKILPIYAMSLILSPMIIFTIAKIYALRGFFLTMFSPQTINAEWFMVLALTYLNLPYMIMPLYSVFRDMPKNILEASSDLGYNKIQTLIKVVIPYSFKAILSGFGLIFLSGATTFVLSAKLLPNGNQLQTIGGMLNNFANPANKYELAQGSALVLVVSAIFIGAYALINFVPKLILKLKKGGTYD